MLFKQLIEFDSPRVLIQEVQSYQTHMNLITGAEGPKIETDAANWSFVNDYFGRSVVLFRDDEGFMRELKSLLEQDLPEEVRL